MNPARVDAYDAIRRDALAGIERRRLRPDDQPGEVRAEVDRAVDEYQRQVRTAGGLAIGDPEAMVQRVLRSITALGPLSDLLARPDVEEVFVEGARVTFLDGAGRLHGLAEPTTEEENRQILDRLLAMTERQLNAKHPIVQARVLDGTARLTAAIPPVADRLSATLRRYTVREVSIERLVARGALDDRAGAFLNLAMRFRSRIAVSGEPGAGKTTLLAALLSAVPAAHCVRVCEEIREIAVPLVHGGYYEVRTPGLDGEGGISLRDLVKFVLAMRPDRIVVGEVRGAEAFELTRAVNAGCGFLCTVHANRAAEVIDALVNAALMAGENVTEAIVRRVFSAAIDFVVHVDRSECSEGGGIRRRITEIAAVVPGFGDRETLEPLFARSAPERPLEWTGAVPPALEERMDRVVAGGRGLRSVLESGGAAA